MENRVVLSTFTKKKKKKRILTVSQSNTNISIQQSETLKFAGGERSLQVQSHKKESISAGEAERQPGSFPHHSKQRSAIRQTRSRDKHGTPPGTQTLSSLDQSLDPCWMEQLHMSTCASARLSRWCLPWAWAFLQGKCNMVTSGECCGGIFRQASSKCSCDYIIY